MFQTIPGVRHECWTLLKSLISLWLRPLTEDDGTPLEQLKASEKRLDLRLPSAFCEWYGLMGNAGDVWSCQDHLLMPEEFFIRDDVLVFYLENQNCWSMGIRLTDLAGSDPPVVSWMGEAWVETSSFGELNPSFSEFSLQLLAWVMKWACRNKGFFCYLENGYSRYGEIGWWTPSTLGAIESHYIQCAFPAWRLWGWPTFFYEGPDALIEVNYSDEKTLYFLPERRRHWRNLRELLSARTFRGIVRNGIRKTRVSRKDIHSRLAWGSTWHLQATRSIVLQRSGTPNKFSQTAALGTGGDV